MTIIHYLSGRIFAKKNNDVLRKELSKKVYMKKNKSINQVSSFDILSEIR
jgi:hypothetical protein